MYEDYSEIPLEELARIAENDLACDKSEGKYLLCLRVNSESIYSKSSSICGRKCVHRVPYSQMACVANTVRIDNIYVAILKVDYKTARSSNQLELLRSTLTSLSDKDAFHEDSPVPAFISLDVVDPCEPAGKRHYGGS